MIIKNGSLLGNMVNVFYAYRAEMSERILASDNKVLKRIYSVDSITYQDGALSAIVKQMLGLASSNGTLL